MSIPEPPDTSRRISLRARSIAEATTLAIAAEAKRMQADGIHVVSLATGEPDFPTPDHIKQAAVAAIEANFTKYTQAAGIPELRQAVADKFARDNGINVTPNQVLVTGGGKHAIFNALSAVVDEGDEILIPSPYWTSYPDVVKLAMGTPVLLQTSVDTGYKITASQVRAAIGPRTRGIILNSPSNPTGVMYTPDELRDIGRAIADAGIYVVSDELYEKIVYDGNEHLSIGSMPELRDLAVTVNGVSKAFSMTGWRVGYMCGPEDVVAAAARIQSQMTSNISSISQRAALAALTGGTADVERMVAAFERRRNLIVDLLGSVPEIEFPHPDGAFYIFMKIDRYFSEKASNSGAVSAHLLRNHHVATVPGSAFGDDTSLRLSYSCSEEDIVEGVARLSRGLRELAE